MTEWYLVLAIFWGAFLLDGLRRSRRATFGLSRTAPAPAAARHQPIHALPPAPWAWRFRADDPPWALSPDGLCNRPLGTAGRPAEPPPARVRRWEEFTRVTEQDGWLCLDGERFSPAAASHPAAALQRLADALRPLAVADRAARLRGWLRRQYRPAHERRRLGLFLRVTRPVAVANTVTLLLFAAASLAAVPGLLGLRGDAAETLVGDAPWLLAAGAAGYVTGLVLVGRAARRLRRWLSPGTGRAIFSAAMFPPQGLRWRRLLTDAAPPSPHPLLTVLAAGGRNLKRDTAFQTLADLRWPVPVPEPRPPGAAEIRAWHAAAFAPVLQGWLTDAGLDPAALLAPPVPDGPASCAYCPRCRAQFTRPDGRCPHGLALVPLRR